MVSYPTPHPNPNPIITHFDYRIIPVGYYIIIVANIINIHATVVRVVCFPFLEYLFSSGKADM